MERVIKKYEPTYEREPYGEVQKKIEDFKSTWKKEEKLILESMTDLLDLDFSEQEIQLFLVSTIYGGFSNPLTISTKMDVNRFPNTLTHELIHRLGSFNRQGVDGSKIQREMFPEENKVVAYHVVVHAVHKHLYLNVLKEPARLEEDTQRLKNIHAEDYVRSWEIVEERGYENIISAFKAKYHTN